MQRESIIDTLPKVVFGITIQANLHHLADEHRWFAGLGKEGVPVGDFNRLQVKETVPVISEEDSLDYVGYLLEVIDLMTATKVNLDEPLESSYSPAQVDCKALAATGW